MTRLSDETMREATAHAGVVRLAQRRLFEAVRDAMNGRTVKLRTHLNDALPKGLYETYWELPLADHLHARLIQGHDLNRELAERLLAVEKLDHRRFLTDVARDLPDHRAEIVNAVRCENLLAVVEAVFLWLCARKGETVEAAAADLPVDLVTLRAARESFERSGLYRGNTAAARHRRFRDQLDPSSKVKLARSVLRLHKKVSEERKRAPWVWEERDVLVSDVEVERPSRHELQVGVAWRNDYYLAPLQAIVKQLEDARR